MDKHTFIKSSLKIFAHLFWAFATILIGSFIIFLLSNQIPHDNIDIKLANLNISEENANYQHEYEKYYRLENNHLPLFYFSILPNNYYKNVESIVNKKERSKIEELQLAGYDCSKLKSLEGIEISSLKQSKYHYPVIYFHGSNNRYQSYISSAVRGDFGLSKKDEKPVWQKISTSLNWTISIILYNLLISVLISFLCTFYLVKKEGSIITKIFNEFTLVLYSMPLFWIATLVLIFFTGSEYGMQLFHTPLYTEVGDNLFSVITKGFRKMLPVVFCLTLIDVAYITKMLQANIKAENEKTYIVALKSRGISKDSILSKHILPNTMIPFVTLLIGSIPLALGGSLVMEIVFNINGMGRLLYDSIYSADWKVVYGIVLFVLIVTVIMYKIGDVIYSKLDKRIRLQN